MLKQITECGFSEAQAQAALKRKSTLEGAIQWILSSEGAAILAREQQQHPVLAPVPETAAPAVPASTRSILDGRFDIVRMLGRGSFGVAYLVTRVHKDGLGDEFACKSLACATLQEANTGLEEVLAMTKNAHPHLVECCEQGIEQDADGQFVVRIIMEFCDRGDLQAAIARGSPFGAARVLSWTRQVLSALHFLHERKIAHRDVKPGNILLCGAEEVAKLGDLGLASSRDTNSTRSVAGTVAFMAPEMFSGTYGVQARPPPLPRTHAPQPCVADTRTRARPPAHAPLPMTFSHNAMR